MIVIFIVIFNVIVKFIVSLIISLYVFFIRQMEHNEGKEEDEDGLQMKK